ncbi:MAG: alpha/beta hydrolase, partial [Methanosarcinales archaeon]|nr:alpha/beta hydrolase [Methanosarcinales archaeon]
VGHSFGGTVAIAYAGSHGHRVAGLLLADVAGDPGGYPAEQLSQFLKLLTSGSYQTVVEDYWSQILKGSNPGVRDAVMRDLRETARETVVGSFKEVFSYHPLQALGRYGGPRLSVITPLNDSPLSLHRAVLDLPFLLITGTSHWLHMDRPDHFNKILDEFLAQVERED